MRVLIVEDDLVLRSGLVDLLGAAGHAIEAAGDGATGLQRATEEGFDLLLLDLTLPRLDGIELCRRVRMARPSLPILVLTARGSEDEKVRGLEAGADDYVTKPFGARELLARVEALARRSAAMPREAEVLELHGCRIDLGLLQARRNGEPLPLTPREAGILRWLYRHRGRAVPRHELLGQVWGANEELETRTVDMTIANLRQKIEADPAAPRIIVTVKGAGYAWGER
ncbi:MAG TPA: response regulator transcription factor [Thermoanaerobaculia bacterium]|jgi:DNA-binding response OmpR family regulator|nr:response regulator transcription factor [Thermoanaerobaculia bacterium]